MVPTDRGGGEEPREGGARPIKPRRPGAERVRGGASSRRMGHPEAAGTEAQEPRWAALQGQRGTRPARDRGSGLGAFLEGRPRGAQQQSGGSWGREERRDGELRRDLAGLGKGTVQLT